MTRVAAKRRSAEASRDREIAALIERSLDASVESINRRPCLYQSSCRLEEIDVELSEKRTLKLMLKDLSPNAYPAAVRRVRPRFVYDATREIVVYRDILRGASPYVASEIAPKRNRFWLLLERVDGPQLDTIGSSGAWESACRWAAKLHSRPAPFAKRGLVQYNRAFYETWGRRARRFATQASSSSRRARIRWLAEKYERAIDVLLDAPQTFIHGELYPANVLTPRGRIVVIDWETAGIGPGVIDLAALTTGDWNNRRRAAMLETYRRACAPSILPRGDDFERALGCARLALAMRWLGWSPQWKPPRGHARDWLAEGITIAEILKL